MSDPAQAVPFPTQASVLMPSDNDSSVGVAHEATGILLDALLAEYGSLRAEILGLQSSIQQLTLSALAFIAGIATLVVALVPSAPELLVSVLIILPVPFSILLFTFLGHYSMILNISTYISDYISPTVNIIIGGSSKTKTHPVFQWERFHRRHFKGGAAWDSRGLLGLGQGLMVGFPIIGALGAVFFIANTISLTQISWWPPVIIFDIVLVIIILVQAVRLLRRYELF